jgi:tRNA(Ile2) C34 agmatinyltransferase TiaS
MQKSRSVVALVGTCLALVALTACSRGGSEAPAEAVVTGEEVPVDQEQTALCEQIVAQALPVDAATALAEASGYPYLVVESGQGGSADPGTIVFTSADGVVVDCAAA